MTSTNAGSSASSAHERGRVVEELVAAGEPRAVAGAADDGCEVFVLSHRLLAALSHAEEAQLATVTQLWADRQAADGSPIDADIAAEILHELADLARNVSHQNHKLYCWVA